MRSLFNIWVFFLGLSPIISQVGYSKVYDLDEPLVMFFNCQLTGEDTLGLYGLAYSNDTFFHQQGLLFARADTNGNIIDHHIFHDSSGFHYTVHPPSTSFLRLKNDNGYMLIAQKIQSGNKNVLLQLDSNCKLKNVYEYSDNGPTTYAWMLQNIIEVDNAYYLLGVKNINNKLYISVVKVNESGGGIWDKLYGEQNLLENYAGAYCIDNNNIVIGAGMSSLLTVPSDQKTSFSRIFTVDSMGVVKWVWDSEPSTEETGPKGLYRDKDGYWYYNTLRWKYDKKTEVNYTQPKFIKRDSNFNLVFEKPVGEYKGYYNEFFSSILTNNGEWIAAGATVTGPKTLSGWLYRLNTNGDSLWSRVDTAQASGPIAGENFLYSAIELPSGSIIACGYSESLGQTSPMGWLIKVDYNGCIDTLDCSLLSSHHTPVGNNNEPVLYPNPTRSIVHIKSVDNQTRWNKIEVFNVLGQPVFDLSPPYENKINLSYLPKGLYFFHFTKSNNTIVKTILKI